MKVYAIEADSEEEAAVITARTSRSPRTFSDIADEVKEEGYKNFLEENVLGFGHDSVAEGAQTPWIAVEGISDLAGNILATADPQLRVQMTSTRYQSMDARNVVHESGEDGDEVVPMIMDRLGSTQRLCVEAAEASDHPRKLTLARDISRGFMPAGIKTQLAVRHDARGMRDTICYLHGHPLIEVKAVGDMLLSTTKGVIETLLNRHISPAVSSSIGGEVKYEKEPGVAWWYKQGLCEADSDIDLHSEIRAWKESGYRRRMRIAACPRGPYLNGFICSDYGAYRDLRRNRTIHQTDMLPDPLANPRDPLWAFRKSHPDVADKLNNLAQGHHGLDDPYLALMNSIMSWRTGGHALNWAYALRLRSKLPGCHPAYALPMRSLMRQILEDAPQFAMAMGIVECKDALRGVEFSDRC